MTCLHCPGVSASQAVMADAWEEIRRLAADFQRAQFAEATQRCRTLPLHCDVQFRPRVDLSGTETLDSWSRIADLLPWPRPLPFAESKSRRGIPPARTPRAPVPAPALRWRWRPAPTMPEVAGSGCRERPCGPAACPPPSSHGVATCYTSDPNECEKRDQLQI